MKCSIFFALCLSLLSANSFAEEAAGEKCAPLFAGRAVSEFTQSSLVLRLYIIKALDGMDRSYVKHYHFGDHIFIPSNAPSEQRELAYFSQHLVFPINQDLKSGNPALVENALQAIPEYLNMAFRYPNRDRAGYSIYQSEEILENLIAAGVDAGDAIYSRFDPVLIGLVAKKQMHSSDPRAASVARALSSWAL
jgi:hypothetical protein